MVLLEVVVSKAFKVSKETVDILVSKVFKVLQVKQLLAQLVHKDKEVLVV
jgi:hypothetical protein